MQQLSTAPPDPKGPMTELADCCPTFSIAGQLSCCCLHRTFIWEQHHAYRVWVFPVLGLVGLHSQSASCSSVQADGQHSISGLP